ncbi:MAG: helix-turn-helix domain-containing protein [Chloroflexi bacterium AL-W]|nr:helix-turn-helix domain-containing protein [Chloroflexi bacterium AL-N1]NOK65930.1 helix-turn-helix domain-containing protein [Chloroflexi bacterium AL-N10]NOK72811.1 helix-turn-helix domain-containing protein [Chloroflexi bacterium AL-N5]NOK79708.1 helix-turn-helix domain-containing protein [Chloroflexi bacterium AL-W]NOK93033.1 helix-turn-helix domain-containing protein [Chloroflexi bacterium AL-N15]
MLRQVLEALEQAQGPMPMDELSRQLGIERSALEGMVSFWVRKGRLTERNAATCSGHCGSSCGEDSTCVFASTGPRTIELVATPRSR